MRTLHKFNALAFVVALILFAGCASNRTTKTAETDTQRFTEPEARVKPPVKNNTSWWEYALMPVTVGSGLLLWYSDLPGVK